MKPVSVLILLVCAAIVSGKCPDDCKELNFLYESFQCTPNCEGSEDCPRSYDCSSINEHKDMCFYNGNNYNVGETIQNSVTWDHCLGCTCESIDNATKFICYSGSCAGIPRIYKIGSKTQDECVPKQVLGHCCASENICSPFSKCEIGNHEFYENKGKFFHPIDKCSKCTCERGTDSEGVVKCQKDYCLDLLRHQEEVRKWCAPFYSGFQNDCCPTRWICPDDKVSYEEGQREHNGPFCSFGDKSLSIGQKFFIEHDEDKVVCECVLPPFATCSSLKDN